MEGRFTAEVYFESHIFPLRLIDVDETLKSEGGVCFASGVSDWKFHVISHTWSWDIRELSKKVGRVVSEAGSTCYEKSFAGAGFKGEHSYDSLMHFLRILAADGVERAWFDALCINQMDTGEKDREIGQMGAYYGLSQGCYVVCHGIGEGYHAVDCTTGDVPRWFTRAWTIQECILPRKLTFIVQKFNQSTLEALAEISSGVKSFARSWAESNASSIQTAEVDVVTPLSHTGLSSIDSYFQRRVQINHGPADEELYFVDSKDYPHLMMHQYLAWAHMQGKGMAAIHESLTMIFLVFDRRNSASVMQDFLALEDWALLQELPGSPVQIEAEAAEGKAQVHNVSGIMRALGGLEGFRQYAAERLNYDVPASSGRVKPLLAPESLAAQVMDRHCSVEEDRVLSILGLFGIKGELQLRTGQGLEAQLLSLARILHAENPRLLLNLCAVDSSSNGIPNMSWMPDIRHRASSPGWAMKSRSHKNPTLISIFFQAVLYVRFYAAEMLGMDEVGRLKLIAKACQGCLMAVADEKDRYWMEVKGIRFPNATNGNLSPDRVQLGFEKMGLDATPGHMYYRNVSEMMYDNQGIVSCHIYLAGKDLHLLAQHLHAPSPTLICHIWLLLIGYTEDHGKGPLQVLLVCLRGPRESTELHKIGTLFLLESAYIDFSSDKFTQWSLGGFGPDVRSSLAAWKV